MKASLTKRARPRLHVIYYAARTAAMDRAYADLNRVLGQMRALLSGELESPQEGSGVL